MVLVWREADAFSKLMISICFMINELETTEFFFTENNEGFHEMYCCYCCPPIVVFCLYYNQGGITGDILIPLSV